MTIWRAVTSLVVAVNTWAAAVEPEACPGSDDVALLQGAFARVRDHRKFDYDPALAKDLILFSDAAYCGGVENKKASEGAHAVQEWDCPPCREAAALAGGNLSSVKTFANKKESAFGFTGLSEGGPTGTSIVLSFRGSVDQTNTEEDLNQAPLEDFLGLGKVQPGHTKKFDSVLSQWWQQVDWLRRNHTEAKTVLVTGHSSGADLAIRGAVYLTLKTKLDVIAITFGTPQPGDASFAASLASLAPRLTLWSVANRADPVPVCGPYNPPCPQEAPFSKNLTTVGQFIWYPGDLTYGNAASAGPGGWVVCPDDTCQFDIPQKQLDIWDHNYYLGHNMWCCSAAAPPTGRFDPAACTYAFPI